MKLKLRLDGFTTSCFNLSFLLWPSFLPFCHVFSQMSWSIIHLFNYQNHTSYSKLQLWFIASLLPNTEQYSLRQVAMSLVLRQCRWWMTAAGTHKVYMSQNRLGDALSGRYLKAEFIFCCLLKIKIHQIVFLRSNVSNFWLNLNKKKMKLLKKHLLYVEMKSAQ